MAFHWVLFLIETVLNSYPQTVIFTVQFFLFLTVILLLQHKKAEICFFDLDAISLTMFTISPKIINCDYVT